MNDKIKIYDGENCYDKDFYGNSACAVSEKLKNREYEIFTLNEMYLILSHPDQIYYHMDGFGTGWNKHLEGLKNYFIKNLEVVDKYLEGKL